MLYTVSYINHQILNDTSFCLDTTLVDNHLLERRSVTLGMKQVGKLSVGDNTIPDSCMNYTRGESPFFVVLSLNYISLDCSFSNTSRIQFFVLPQIRTIIDSLVWRINTDNYDFLIVNMV